jgi:fatty-acyl-CoA synthase
VDPDEVNAFLRDRLAGYKVPRHIRVVTQLPRNAMGKLVRPELRRTASELLAPSPDAAPPA